MKAAATIVFVAALIAALAAVFAMGANRPLDGDGPYFWAIAKSVAAGNGYVNDLGPWAPKATAERLPVWPTLLAPFAWISHSPAMPRLAGAFYHALGAVCLFFLTLRLCGGRVIPSLAAGLVAAFNPVSLFIVTWAMSETVTVLVMAFGMWMLLSGSPYWGAVMLGLGPVTRANLIVLPVLVLLVALCFRKSRQALGEAGRLRQFAMLGLLFWLPPGVWMARNVIHLGSFPVLSTLEGETLYGANNGVVANDLNQWGYWVFPDEIPGETPKRQLSPVVATEIALNHYYRGKAMEFLRKNWFALPRLFVGKMVRGYVPVPWKPNWGTYLSFLVRGVIDLAVLATAALWFKRTDGRYMVLLGALFGTSIITTLIYYGNFRFTHATIEAYTIPLLGVALAQWMDARSGESEGRRKAAAASAAG